MNDGMNLGALVAKAEEVAAEMKAHGAEYLYDGVYTYHDGFQYWLCTEQGDRVALEGRTMEMFLAFVEKRAWVKITVEKK